MINKLKKMLNNNEEIIIMVLSGSLFFISCLESSYAIDKNNKDNNNTGYDYEFNIDNYIEYDRDKDDIDALTNQKSKVKTHDDNLTTEVNDSNIINLIQKSTDNSIIEYNFVAVGDWYCNEETKNTINNILAINPELIITTGDQVEESPSAACWIQMSEPIKDKMKIA